MHTPKATPNGSASGEMEDYWEISINTQPSDRVEHMMRPTSSHARAYPGRLYLGDLTHRSAYGGTAAMTSSASIGRRRVIAARGTVETFCEPIGLSRLGNLI